jgi:hypothetical protein
MKPRRGDRKSLSDLPVGAAEPFSVAAPRLEEIPDLILGLTPQAECLLPLRGLKSVCSVSSWSTEGRGGMIDINPYS